MVCLYHCDDDGKCAASIVHQFGLKDEFNEVYVEMDYGMPVPYEKVHKNEIVYIVDFSIDPEEMLSLIDITHNVHWIDHHASAIQRYNDFPYGIPGIRLTVHSGCMLTFFYTTNHIDWVDYTAQELIEMDDIPFIINLVDDYDLWRFNLPETRAFHEGFALVDHDPLDVIWTTCDESKLQDILAQGYIAMNYRSRMMAELIQSYGYETQFEGYKTFVINQGLITSDDFKSIDASEYDILIGYIYSGKDGKYVYSLRSLEDGPDVKEIAMKFGGGGHVHAAGFSSEHFLLNTSSTR